jgi:cytochrome P450
LKSVLARERPFDVAEDIIDFSFDAILSAAIGLKDTGGDIDRQLSHLQAFDHSKLVSTDNVSPYEPISFPKPRKSPELLALRVIEQSLWKGFYMPWPRLYHFVNNLRPSVQNANRTLKTYIRTQTRNAASRLEEGEEPQSALDYIIQREVRAAEKANREPHLEDPRVRDGVYGYLIAGHDTSSGSLTWLIRRLVAHPEEQAKIRASLRETYSVAWAEKRFPSAAELVQTAPYLDAFVEEVLRFNCPAVTIAVSTRRDTSILGHAVPRDTAVFLNLTGPSLNMPSIAVDETLRSPTSQARRDMRPTWDDAEPTAFQPERWLSTDHTGKVTFNPRSGPTLSFSAGERGCWGKRLGYLELKVLLSLLVWAFSFGTVPEELGSWETCDSLVTGPKHCFVQLSQL